MKTITPYDILQSELINQGHSEFVDEQGNWIFHDKDHQFIQKILRYDEVIHEIITDSFFYGLSLDDSTHDKHFKRTWITKFYNRQIRTQTLESFAGKVIQVFLTHEEYLNRVYTDLEKYLTGEQMSESSDTSESSGMNNTESMNDSRTGSQSQAQNRVNLDIDNHVLDWADDFNINRQNSENFSENENRSTSESENVTRQYNMENLERMNLLLEQVLLKFDRDCFLQIW